MRYLLKGQIKKNMCFSSNRSEILGRVGTHIFLLKKYYLMHPMQCYISLVHYLPVYTNYRCIPFPPNHYHVRYYHLEFSTQHCLQCIFLSPSKKKKAEMSFLRVSDLLLVCVVLIHDADSSLYIIKMIFLLKINEKLPLEKCVCLLRKILTAWFPA